MIRQPIVSVLGHVDHGKTTLLDKIRGTTVAAKEAGFITQHIGATEIPLETIKETCGKLLDKFNIKVVIPGLLFIDTPGHEAFTSLRKRGGSIADLAVLVVDITEGFQAQTDESLEFLKQFKTPFVVAATKIDKSEGWISHKGLSFLESFQKQAEHVRDKAEKSVYKIVGQLSERGFDSERFDRVSDFKNNVAIVPCSGITGEGVPDLLMVLTGLAQQFLKKELEITSEVGYGSILEIKEVKGLGVTIDAILHDGEIRRGDWLIIGGKEPRTTKVKALLKPSPRKELRVEKQFDNVDSVSAAAGIKISAPGLEHALAGSPIASLRSNAPEDLIERISKEFKEAAEEIEFETDEEGIVLKADTLGSLEALVHILKRKNIKIKKAEVGKVLRKDVIEVETIKDPYRKAIIAFNVGIDEIAEKEAKDKSLRIIKGDIIYRLIEEYEIYIEETRQKITKAKLESINLPARIKILPGMVFHVSNPAIVGVEVLAGTIKAGFKLQKNGKEIGEIKAIQSENVSLEKAKKGDRVAVSIEGPTVGRHIREGEELSTIVTKNDLRVLEELGLKEEIELAKELLKM